MLHLLQRNALSSSSRYVVMRDALADISVPLFPQKQLHGRSERLQRWSTTLTIFRAQALRLDIGHGSKSRDVGRISLLGLGPSARAPAGSS